MRPTPGKQYTIQDENTLSLVARRAYGDATYWRRIWNANQTTLRSGNPDLIFPGEVILIPVLPERQLPTTADPNKDPFGMFLNLNGREIRPQAGRLIRSMDLVANAFNCNIGSWVHGQDPELDNLVKPRSYTPATASIGGNRVVTGRMYTPESDKSNGSTLNLEGFTNTVDLVTSTMKPPLEFNKVTLADLLDQIVKPLGYNVIFEADTGGAFDRVTAQRGQTIFSFLSNLARQRGVLLSCNTGSDLVVTRANVDGASVAVLEENVTQGVTGWRLRVDGTQSFNTYRATGQSPLGTEEGIAIDNNIPVSRFKEITANESQSGNLKAAAEWARNKALADALGFPLTVEDWYNQQNNGIQWEENTIVTVISPTMFLPQGFNFLVNRVEYVLSSGGRSSVLSFVPPTVYSQGETVDPWA